MMGRGDGQEPEPLADCPVTFLCSWRRSGRRSMRSAAARSSTAPSAQAATRAPSSMPIPQNTVIAIDRDPDAIARWRFARRQVQEAPDARSGTLRRPRRDRAGAGFRARRRRRARHRRVVDAARPGRARLLVPQRGAARHAHGAADRARPISSTKPPRPSSPTSSTITARSGAPAPSRAPSSSAAPAAIETTRQLADLVASLIRQEPSGIHPATRVFQGCASPSTTSSASWCARCTRPSASSSPAAASSS